MTHIFFDLDDTLYDFQKNSGIALKELYEEHHLQAKLNVEFEIFLAAYKEINLRFWQLYHRKEIDKLHLRNNRFHETFKRFGYDNYADNLTITEEYLQRAPKGKHLKEGCLDLLDHLKGRYHLHIITNGFKEIQQVKISQSGIAHYFSNIIVSEVYNLSKPDEAIFRLSESLAGSSRDQCVMIGDSYESDIAGALNAGWRAIWLTDGPKQEPVQQIRRLSELKAFF